MRAPTSPTLNPTLLAPEVVDDEHVVQLGVPMVPTVGTVTLDLFSDVLADSMADVTDVAVMLAAALLAAAEWALGMVAVKVTVVERREAVEATEAVTPPEETHTGGVAVEQMLRAMP